jgi:hypothetical protein
LLERIHDENGIRVEQLLKALQTHAPAVLSTWIGRVKLLAEKVKTIHWQEDIWNVPGAPRISLLIDNAAMGYEGLDDDEYFTTARLEVSDRVAIPPHHWRPDLYPNHKMLDGHITRHCYMMADD